MYFYCRLWRLRYLQIEGSHVVETRHYSVDEFQSQCLCVAPSVSSNVRRLAPLLRVTSEIYTDIQHKTWKN